MDTFYNKITAYPFAMIGGVTSSINFDDFKPVLVVVMGFVIDILISWLKKKFNDKG